MQNLIMRPSRWAEHQDTSGTWVQRLEAVLSQYLTEHPAERDHLAQQLTAEPESEK